MCPVVGVSLQFHINVIIPRRNLRWLRSLEASYHSHFFLCSSHCAIYFCSSILSLSQCSPFTLFLHSVSSKKKISMFFVAVPSKTARDRTQNRNRGMGGAASSWGRWGDSPGSWAEQLFPLFNSFRCHLRPVSCRGLCSHFCGSARA